MIFEMTALLCMFTIAGTSAGVSEEKFASSEVSTNLLQPSRLFVVIHIWPSPSLVLAVLPVIRRLEMLKTTDSSLSGQGARGGAEHYCSSKYCGSLSLLPASSGVASLAGLVITARVIYGGNRCLHYDHNRLPLLRK